VSSSPLFSVAPAGSALARREPAGVAPGATGTTRIAAASLPSAIPVAPGAGALALPPPSGPTWYTSVPQTDYHQIWTSDVEPSQAYGSDRTALMIGPDHHCSMVACSQIYRSSDGGATWSFLTGQAATGVQLLLPASFNAGQNFYAVGLTGVEVTRDNGVTFADVLPVGSGTAMAPPASSELDVVYSGTGGLWGIPRQGTPTLLSTYEGTDQATGTPLLLHTATGYAVLQPVTRYPSSRNDRPYFERCTPQCGPDTALPFHWLNPRFFASPEVATDHTVYAVSGTDLGVSHDDGLTFTAVVVPLAADMIATEGPAGRRLVAAIGDTGQSLGYSDDDGATWHRAAIPNSALTNARNITQLRPGRLIASMMRSDDWGWYYFVCSRDGGAWTACTPDQG
jgi:hypothetical protein